VAVQSDIDRSIVAITDFRHLKADSFQRAADPRDIIVRILEGADFFIVALIADEQCKSPT
jgi:hypothetical protein